MGDLGCLVMPVFMPVFAAADWLRHPHPSGLLYEEAPLVCAEEQENRLQASEIERTQHTAAGVRGRPEGVAPGGPHCCQSQNKLLPLTHLSA